MTDESIADDVGVEADEIEEAEDLDAAPEGVGDEDEAQADDAEEEAEEEAEPEEVEIDLFGTKKTLPKGAIPDELLTEIQESAKGFEAAYTKKSQALAEQVKSVEATKAVVDKLADLQGEALDRFSQGLVIQQEIRQLQQYDLNQLWQSNPDQARQISDTLSAKKAELTRVQHEVQAKESEFTQAQQEEAARRMEAGKQTVLQHAKDFDAPAVVEYAVSTYGIPQKDADNWALNPAAAIAMHKAMKWDQMQAKAKAKPTPQKAKPVTPMKATGRAAATPDIADMTPAQMAKHLGLPG